jgi:hypothetical protein
VFAESTFAQAPFASQGGAGGRNLDGLITESAVALDTTAARATFPVSLAESSTAADTVLVAASVFNTLITEAASAGPDTVSVLVDFAVLITENVTSADSAFVEPSIFNAPISETAAALDSSFPIGTYFVTITDGATAADQIAARLLWETINDAQTANWAGINNAQTPGWTVVYDGQTDTWQVIKTQG